jgi:hypothetical protein
MGGSQNNPHTLPGWEDGMTKAKTGKQIGLECFKVRIAVSGAVLHILSTTEPVVHCDGGSIASVDWEPIDGTEHGDTVGFVRWADVSAITWRKARLSE